ncbi:hypothetical protein [Streptomyces sp. S186]|uniref:hypothetical protein n=1 Tax=Streptomyces sp. S186 TaxID=3434395 RepID=UPI003F670C9E
MRKDTGIPGRRPRIPALCRLPLLALAVVLTLLLGAAAPAYSACSARPAAAATGSAGSPAAANANSEEEEKHSKRETERGRPRRTAPAAQGFPATRRPLPPSPGGAADDGTRGRIPATRGAPAPPRPDRLPVLHCVFRC